MTTLDLSKDKLLTPVAAAALIPCRNPGKQTHPDTVKNWMRYGLTLPDGRVLKLESVWMAGRRLTSVKAVERFVLAQQGGPEVPADDQPRPAGE